MKELEEFANWLTVLGYCHQKVYQYPRTIEHLLAWTKQAARTLDFEAIEVFTEFNRTRLVKGKFLSVNYLNTELTAIRTFAKFMKQTHGVNIPTGQLMNYKQIGTPPNYLTEDEIQQIYAVTDTTKFGYRDRAFLAVCYGAGLRRSEVIGLNVKDLDLKRGYVHVIYGKNYKERMVPLPPKAIADLRAYILDARPMFRKGKKYQRELFLGYRGSPIKGKILELRIKHLAQQTGNTKLIQKKPTPHTLRHSIATHLLHRNVPLEHVSRFLGHNSLDSTQVYTHIEPP